MESSWTQQRFAIISFSLGFFRNDYFQEIHGIHDEVVPIDESRTFVGSHPWCSLKELDADHGLLSHVDWIINDCVAFFKKNKFLSR